MAFKKSNLVHDAQWEIIKNLLPLDEKQGGRPPKDIQMMLNAILWIDRTGAPWRNLQCGRSRACCRGDISESHSIRSRPPVCWEALYIKGFWL
ncbi:transposase [Paenibacillus sepulcri]|uniref:Transposase n=1 Tax=Paenibacillus sepulcri TaxID=359917 RepID=A0ABS7BWQ5_9BACL|nr:transposase [Paenibacillus sepulcri]